MHAKAQVGRLFVPIVSLDNSLEELDIGAVEDGRGRIAQRRPVRADVRIQIPDQASRIVSRWIRVYETAHVDRVVDKRPAMDATATGAEWEVGEI